MPWNYAKNLYELNPACPETDCYCNLCYENQPGWARGLYVYTLLIFNLFVFAATAYTCYLLWKKNMTRPSVTVVLVSILLESLVALADQTVFSFTYAYYGVMGYTGTALACIAILFSTVTFKQALNAALNEKLIGERLWAYVIAINILIVLVWLLGVIGDRALVETMYTAANGLFGFIIIILLLAAFIWIFQLTKLLKFQLEVLKLNKQKKLSATFLKTIRKVRLTLLVVATSGIVGIGAVVYHALYADFPSQFMVFWWIPRLSCLCCMTRLVLLYYPDQEGLKMTRNSSKKSLPKESSQISLDRQSSAAVITNQSSIDPPAVSCMIASSSIDIATKPQVSTTASCVIASSSLDITASCMIASAIDVDATAQALTAL